MATETQLQLVSIGAFKRGDQFGFYATLKDGDGAPLTIDATDVRSQVRDADDRLYATLDVRKHPDTVGTYLFSAEGTVTQRWPVATLYIDIEMTLDGAPSSTATFTVTVVKDITRP